MLVTYEWTGDLNVRAALREIEKAHVNKSIVGATVEPGRITITGNEGPWLRRTRNRLGSWLGPARKVS